MTFEQFDKFQAALISKVVKMRDTKGKEYANDADRFANFRRLAQQLGMKDYQVGWVYGVKHFDALASFMRTGKEFSSEGIRGRIVDAITYLTLIAGMIEEAVPARKPRQAKDAVLKDENVGKDQPFEYDQTPETGAAGGAK
jgi:hypothetical protein